jgi:hypothetical protein
MKKLVLSKNTIKTLSIKSRVRAGSMASVGDVDASTIQPKTDHVEPLTTRCPADGSLKGGSSVATMQ